MSFFWITKKRRPTRSGRLVCPPWTLFCPGGCCAGRGRCWAASCRPRSWGPGRPLAGSCSTGSCPHWYNALRPPGRLHLQIKIFYFRNIFNEGSLAEMWGNLNRCEMLEIIIYRMLRYLKQALALHSTYYNQILTRSSSEHFPIWQLYVSVTSF